MEELPELLADAVGDVTVLDRVDLGGGDEIAVTPERTFVYRSDGLLRDESIERYDHDVEQLAVDAGRRKHDLVFTDYEGSERLTVPARAIGDTLEAVLEGVLRTTGVVDDGESVNAVFRFNELTVVVTDEQLLKHVGSAVWNDDYDAVRYEALTGMDVEQGSVNTQVIVRTDSQQERVKVANDHAPRVRNQIEEAVFSYYDVSTLGKLRELVDPEAEESDEESEAEAADHGARGDDGERVASGDTENEPADAGSAVADDERTSETPGEDGFVSADWSPPADQDVTGPNSDVARRRVDRTGDDSDDVGEGTGVDDGDGRGLATAAAAGGDSTDSSGKTGGTEAADSTDPADGTDTADLSMLEARVDHLSEQLETQTELLERQQSTIERLVEELRRGR